MKGRIILDLCGGTGSWSRPYLEAGYDVRLVTMPDQDVRKYSPPSGVHGILLAPPCDHFSGSGARWWKGKDKDGRTAVGLSIFDACIWIVKQCSPVWWVLENPVGRLPKLRPALGKPVMRFNPCDYGDPYTKRTCLWGVFNEPKKNPVEPVMYTDSKGHRGSYFWKKLGGKSEKTKRLRSITPPGFAKAFFEANP